MFIFTATAHFNKMKHDLARMIPAYFPLPLLIVYITGVLELLGAAGLMLPQFRRLAGFCLIVLLVGMFIANVNAAQRHVHTARQASDTALVAGSNADFVYCATLVVNCKRQGKHTIDRFNPQWICRFQYDRWDADRARFLADRVECQMEEL